MNTLTPRQILDQVKDRIMAAPETYKQTGFCGTQCCLAGHIDVILNGAEVHNARPRTQETLDLIPFIAAKAIGDSENTWLFGTTRETQEYECENGDPWEDYDPTDGFWPPDLSDEYEAADGVRGRALVGCKAIDRYIAQRGL